MALGLLDFRLPASGTGVGGCTLVVYAVLKPKSLKNLSPIPTARRKLDRQIFVNPSKNQGHKTNGHPHIWKEMG